MNAQQAASQTDPYKQITLSVLQLVFAERFARNFSIALWDGTIVSAQDEERFQLCINEPGALRAAFRPPIDLNAGRAFAAGIIECRGSMEDAVDELYRTVDGVPRGLFPKLMALLLRLPKTKIGDLREAHLHGKLHSIERDRAAIGFHYDQPLAFYRSFLDNELVYSCAYFDDGVTSLDDAQRAKLDYSLRKLRLQPGESLLDIGCGWGGLVIRAAQKFGAKALGVTLSASQHAEANRRIAELGIGDRARVELRDYRELADGSFDKIASIGMFEHVGRSRLPEYFNRAFALLRPGGLFLNHGIAEQSPGRSGGKVSGFMERFIFPDGELVAVSDALAIAERSGFEVRDVEGLREHYMRTLRLWVKNLETHASTAIAEAGLQSYRAWRLYMAASAQGFRVGRMGLFQSLLAKPMPDGHVTIPPTRRDLYESGMPALSTPGTG
ncbi:MAG: cyclopropane-fatty-acyl-phospholipid synthase family protein [Candidatus Eremiobacteraeota bacterium]|nr:cyclopropane-fatty-acyl-phospholipid synthase family protein [Candidatus Eremiobacteraeota bacterium]